MNRSVNEHSVRILFSHTNNGSWPTMGGTVIYNPEDASRIIVGWLGHDLVHKPVERDDAIFSFAMTKEFDTVYIQCSEIGPCSTSSVFVFHFHR